MTTFSTSLKLELPGDGQQSGTWGQTTNRNLGTLLEQAITGVQSILMVDANYTLSNLNGVSDEARNAVLVVTGTNSAVRNIIIPSVNKVYTVTNNTTGGYSITIKTSGGTGYTIPNGTTGQVYCNGTDCFQALSYMNSPTFTGTPIAPTAAYGTSTTQLATTAFVQAALQALYPVGSVYINASDATSPATLFGFGTWATIGDGKVLVNQDSTDTSFDVLGETGGSKDAINVAHTHTATSTSSVSDPGHTHVYGAQQDLFGSGASSQWPRNALGDAQNAFTTASRTTGITVSTSTTVASAGSSGTNANLQPYVVVKMWKRTA